jgi:hypothetical protein
LAIAFGASCRGTVYYPVGSGWALCEDGTWRYSICIDPADAGYTIYTGGGDGGSSGDGSSGDGSSSSDGSHPWSAIQPGRNEPTWVWSDGPRADP